MPHAVVVGAGVLGVCVADRLAGDGWSVDLVDQAPPGHVRATSGGETRVLRSAHGADAWYAASARRARTRWLALQEELGVPLYHETGVSWLAQRADGIEAASERTLRSLGIPVERLAPADAPLPGLRADGLAYVLHEPEAGFLRARAAVQALAARAVRARGVRLRLGDVAVPVAGGGVQAGGARIDGDLVVWATGPWLPRAFPALVDMRVVRRDYLYLGAGPDWSAGRVGPWIDYEAAVYGFGDLDGSGVKVAWDGGAEPFDPDSGRRDLHAPTERAVRDYLARRFPALADAPLVGWRTCQYELTPDTHFIVARHPSHRRVWLLGGGSGHAFKHGPALADLLVALVESGAEPDARFALGPRSAGVSLVTAGATAPAR